jgi:hypothetical protein
VLTIPPAILSSRTTPSMTLAICSCRKFRKCAAMLRRAAIRDKRPTKAAKHKEPGRVPSLCPLSMTMERMRTRRLKRAWKAREARMGREDAVVAIMDDVEKFWDARVRRVGEEMMRSKRV